MEYKTITARGVFGSIITKTEKPRISKHGDYWLCNADIPFRDLFGKGTTPSDAFEDWRKGKLELLALIDEA